MNPLGVGKGGKEMANEIWQQLTSVEEEAERLIIEAKQEVSAFMAKRRQDLEAEREVHLATAEKAGKAELETVLAEAERKVTALQQETDQQIKDLRNKAAAQELAVVEFIKERIRG
jgi:vacuolar-type H+-ATPase subunit H